MKTVIVTGGNSGLGKAIVELLGFDYEVYSYDVEDGYDCTEESDSQFEIFMKHHGITKVDVLVNNAGVNFLHSIGDIKKADWDRIMDINTWGILNMTQKCLPFMSEGSKIINITSNAYRVPMTHSVVYNASKGAAQIMTRQMARELTRRDGIIVYGVAPNKMSGTGMSDYIDEFVCKLRGWTREEAREYQNKSLVCGEETPTTVVAELVAHLVDKGTKHFTGCVFEAGY